MTTKEIAQAVGKDPDTIQLWIKKILQPSISVDQPQNAVADSIREKAGSKDSRNPADYTLEETIAIIEAGMGPEAAGIYRNNAFAVPCRPARALSGAFLRELNAAYNKAIISRTDWRCLAGLPPEPDNAGKRPALPKPEKDPGTEKAVSAFIEEVLPGISPVPSCRCYEIFNEFSGGSRLGKGQFGRMMGKLGAKSRIVHLPGHGTQRMFVASKVEG